MSSSSAAATQHSIPNAARPGGLNWRLIVLLCANLAAWGTAAAIAAVVF
jgi:hypothetical protein